VSRFYKGDKSTDRHRVEYTFIREIKLELSTDCSVVFIREVMIERGRVGRVCLNREIMLEIYK